MIIDSYAWIEYFFGSKQGQIVADIIEKNNCITLESNLAEIYEWTIRSQQEFKYVQEVISAKSKIISVNRQDWLRAVELKLEMRKKKKKFGLLDAVILAKQEELKCKIITGDPYFEGQNKVIFLE